MQNFEKSFLFLFVGIIKYQTLWQSEGVDLGAFVLPRSFSLDHYIRLFCALYNTCGWSSNHTIRLLHYLLKHDHKYTGISSAKKQRKWLFDFVIDQYIGRELFLEKLLHESNETTLDLFERYVELTTPLSRHLFSQSETNKTLTVKQRVSFIRYQFMTEDIFDQFIILFNQTSSNINQRENNYVLFLQCALTTNDEQVKNVLHWIRKQFGSERLSIIEHFLGSLSEMNNQDQTKILTNTLDISDQIVEIAINHPQRSKNTLTIIVRYGLSLLQNIEYYQEKQLREHIQTFSCNIIRK